MPDTMYALTLWPEWLPAFTHMGKRVENRTWMPPSWLLGQRIALHAGKQIGGGKRAAGIRWLGETATHAGWMVFTDGLDMSFVRLPGLPPGVGPEGFTHAHIHLGAVVATAELYGVSRVAHLKSTAAYSPWAILGSVHWLLRDVVVLPKPVPMRGRQGLWKCEL